MSEVAGRLAAQVGAHYLMKPFGGRGVLLGGVPGVPPAKVLVLGGGIVGYNAAQIARRHAGRRHDVRAHASTACASSTSVLGRTVLLQMSTRHAIEEALPEADLVIGGVLIPGAKAPRLVTRDDARAR